MLPLTRLPSAAFGLVLGVLAHSAGWPLARGGSQQLADGLASYLGSLGGEVETGRRVGSLAELGAARPVLLDVSPRALAGLGGAAFPSSYRRRLERFRYGPGVFKLDWALDGPIPWRAPECASAATVHLGATLEEIVASEREPWRGGISERPFVLLAQQSLFDSSRAPAGKHTAWAYCHVPNGSRVDMTERDRGAGRAVRAGVPRARDRALGDGAGGDGGAQPELHRRRHQRRRRRPPPDARAARAAGLAVCDAAPGRLPLFGFDAARRGRARDVRVPRGSCSIEVVTSSRDLRRLSFGPSAELYESIRPSYPPDAARWILGDAPLRVADLGAGTGKFSRVLASLGHEVIAVEPDPEMRALLVETSLGVTAVAGSGESIPLRNESVDAVVAAQAFHWFANDMARAEIARVVRPGGVFGPIWNVRDDSVSWVRELTRTVLQGDSLSWFNHSYEHDFGPAFGVRERADFRFSVEHTVASLLDLVRSRSKYLVADEAERERLLAAAEVVVARLPEPFELPYITIAYRAVRFLSPVSSGHGRGRKCNGEISSVRKAPSRAENCPESRLRTARST